MGLVLISESFLAKPWPLGELLRLLMQTDRVLPVLYLTTLKELRGRVAAEPQVSLCMACWRADMQRAFVSVLYPGLRSTARWGKCSM